MAYIAVNLALRCCSHKFRTRLAISILRCCYPCHGLQGSPKMFPTFGPGGLNFYYLLHYLVALSPIEESVRSKHRPSLL